LVDILFVSSKIREIQYYSLSLFLKRPADLIKLSRVTSRSILGISESCCNGIKDLLEKSDQVDQCSKKPLVKTDPDF
jgi:hypothetical protein